MKLYRALVCLTAIGAAGCGMSDQEMATYEPAVRQAVEQAGYANVTNIKRGYNQFCGQDPADYNNVMAFEATKEVWPLRADGPDIVRVRGKVCVFPANPSAVGVARAVPKLIIEHADVVAVKGKHVGEAYTISNTRSVILTEEF